MSIQQLEELLVVASEAGPETRIEHRDAVASFGPAAIAPMCAWASDPRLGAFAVRVLGRIAQDDAQVETVMASLQQVVPPSDAVARDISALTIQLQAQIEARRTAAAHRVIQEELLAAANRRRAQVEPARGFLRATTGKPWSARSAERLLEYLDRLEEIRNRSGATPLRNRRSEAVFAWIRMQSPNSAEKRVSVCWNCGAGVYSDLNPACETCLWMVCVCDACRDPEHRKGPCPRTAARAWR
jgi:hypothetical protein